MPDEKTTGIIEQTIIEQTVDNTPDAVSVVSETDTSNKDFDADAMVKSIFNRMPEITNEQEDKPVKPPENIFSKPIPVTHDDMARRARLKIVVIEGILFGAFLTAITVIASLTGISNKLSPETAVNTPSVWFFVAEFIFFSIAVTIGNYFLTEYRVNRYNQRMAGVNFDIDDEIERALKEQAAEGITAETAAEQNKSNGASSALIEVRCTKGEASLTDKTFEASIDGEKAGELETVKGTVVDANGFENIVLLVSRMSANEGDYKNGVVMDLITAAKNAASDNALAAVVIPESVYGDLTLNMSDGEKYKISYKENIKVREAYPGALMGITGELR